MTVVLKSDNSNISVISVLTFFFLFLFFIVILLVIQVTDEFLWNVDFLCIMLWPYGFYLKLLF